MWTLQLCKNLKVQEMPGRVQTVRHCLILLKKYHFKNNLLVLQKKRMIQIWFSYYIEGQMPL